MGGFSAQVQQPQTNQPNQSMGKGGGMGGDQQYEKPQMMWARYQEPQPNPSMNNSGGLEPPAPSENVQPQQQPQAMGKGGVQTNSATSGQPRAGMPNQYSNTVGQWDNARIQPQQSHGGGKGKG